MNILIVATLLSVFSLWEISLLFSMALRRRERTLGKIFLYEDRAISSIFSMFRAYRGFKVRVEKSFREPLPDRFIVVANHQSLLDIPIIMENLPKGKHARFVAKKELSFGIPLISLLLRSGGHCLVKRRGDALHAMRSISAMAKRCDKEGTIPVIFPEGTRSRTGDLGTFHSAGYRKILEVSPLPILVVALEGGWSVVTLRDFFSNFGKKPYTVRFIGLLPAPQGKREALASLGKAREMIAGALDSMRGR